LDIDVVYLSESARTAQLAADALNTALGSIVKSLVFLADGSPVLVLVAGDRRASPEKLRKLLKARRVTIADADRVREETGFSIGGVPPVGHQQPLPVWIDASLSRFATVHAAAGHHQAVFPIPYQALVRTTNGQVADLTETPRQDTS
jgi:prolyl-tRNA editing enzyme YbaK/EbsC (Cys-tRNA(Pro) deacylase)